MKSRFYILTALSIVAPTAAYANAGLPMLMVTLPAMLVGLIPIAIVETVVLVSRLRSSVAKTATLTAAANVATTLVGIPATWTLLALLQLVTGGGAAYGIDTPLQKMLAVTWQAPWLIPHEADLGWMIPAAMLVLLVPFFFASWAIEAAIVSLGFRPFWNRPVRAAVWRANVVSSALLSLYPLSMFIVGPYSPSSEIIGGAVKFYYFTAMSVISTLEWAGLI